MREAQIYITKHWKTEQITNNTGGFVSHLGGIHPPKGGVKISLTLSVVTRENHPDHVFYETVTLFEGGRRPSRPR